MPAWQKSVIGILALLALMNGLGLTDSLNRWLTDAHWQFRASFKPTPFPNDILIVAIDDKTLRKLGRIRHWSRKRYAQLLERLRLAKAVGIDILFSEPDEKDPQGDAAFAAAVRRHGRVVLPFHQWQGRILSEREREATKRLKLKLPTVAEGKTLHVPFAFVETFQPPLPSLLDAASALGYADVNADPDGVYRKPIILRQTSEGKLMPHFALAVACVAEGKQLTEVLQSDSLSLRFGDRAVPLDGGTLWLNHIVRRSDLPKGLGSPVPTISFVDALTMQPEKFAGKIVLVGETATGTTDIRPTPLDNGLRGVELNAEIIANLLFLPPFRPLPLALQLLLVSLAALLPLWLYSAKNVRVATMSAFASVFALAVLMEAAFWLGHWLPNFSAPLLAWLSSTLLMGLQRLAQEEAQKRQIRQTFSLYVAPELVEEIVKNPEIAHQEGVRQRVAVLFSDIRDFTSYSEQNPPELVVRQMREYLTEMTAAVQNHRGILDKFIGDAVMALYGPFLPDGTNISALAIASALEMLERLEKLNERWHQQGMPTFRIGISIHVGEAIVGNIGSIQRVQYTALGDTVNLASRLQALTKDFKVPLLVSKEIKEEAEKVLGDAVMFTDLGTVTVRGREKVVRVYAVQRRREAADRSLEVATLLPSSGGD